MAGTRRAALLEDLRAQVARIEGYGAEHCTGAIPFGVQSIDATLPGGGIARGALHEVAGAGPDIEHASAVTLLVAGLLAQTSGPILWVSEYFDLFAPALAGVGLDPTRVLHVESGRAVLMAMEEGLRHPGLTGVVGEFSGRISLTASRRLQLAAESSGAVAFVIRRGPRFDDTVLTEPTAAVTRWRVACLPSPPPLPHAPETPGLGRARWRLDLVRCRGGEPASWTVEACDAQGRLALASDLADRQAAPQPKRRTSSQLRRAAG
jgi:protein ImuA